VECIARVKKCQKRAKKDQLRGCNEFLNEFKRDTQDAKTDARRAGVLGDFVDWFFGDSSRVDEPTSDECLARATAITEFCAGTIDIIDIP